MVGIVRWVGEEWGRVRHGSLCPGSLCISRGPRELDREDNHSLYSLC